MKIAKWSELHFPFMLLKIILTGNLNKLLKIYINIGLPIGIAAFCECQSLLLKLRLNFVYVNMKCILLKYKNQRN